MITGRFHIEVLSWTALTITAWAISAHFSVFDTIVAFSKRHERWQVDEALTLILFLSIAAFVSSFIQSRQRLRSRRRAEREAFAAARRDVLTGLPNRRMFTELAGAALGEAWVQGGRCAVLFIDLDGFKPVNDTYGHAAGDTVLRTIAQRLSRIAPNPDLVARFGGDEFAVLLPAVVDENASVEVAHRVLASVEQPIEISGQLVRVGSSIGIAAGPENGRRAEDLIHAADLAMYAAKQSRRGTVCICRPAAEPVVDAVGSSIGPGSGQVGFLPLRLSVPVYA